MTTRARTVSDPHQPGSSIAGTRQLDTEGGPCARRARSAQVASHAARELAADRESQSGAFRGAGERRLDLDEGLEDRCELRRLDADASVAHVDAYEVGLGLGIERD